MVLFDEIEKAHPDVFNVLLQVLDDGRITDSQGRTVDFKNTILIMTSNIGSGYLLDGIDDHGNISEDSQQAVMEELKAHFRPEFLNRLDEMIMFKPLTKDNSYDPTYGARPLKRYLQKHVETLAARLMLQGDVGAQETIVIDAEDGRLTARSQSLCQ